jgi:hypothetical protein
VAECCTKLANKRQDPNYEQVSGVVSRDVSRRFRQVIAARGLKISDGLEEAMQEYVDRYEPEFTASSTEPETITQLVQQNYFAILRSGKLATDKLQAIAEGEEPSRNDLYIISSVVKIPQKELVALHKRTFGHAPLSNGERELEKRRDPNGASNH